MPGLRGFFYTLAFASLALLIALWISWYASRPLPARPPSTGSVAADIAADVLQFNNVSFEVTKAGARTILTVRDYLPTTLSRPAAEMDAYELFVATTYASRTNHNISLDVPASRYILQPFRLTYAHPTFAKGSFVITNVDKVEGYALRARLNVACLNNDCSRATTGTWRWTTSGLWVALDVRDANGNPIAPGGRTSGFIRKTTTESFQTALQGGGYVNVTVARGSLRVTVSGARAATTTNITLTGAPVTQLELPLSLSVDGRDYPSVVLLTK
ncbi:MAG: hypothetical protein QXG98_03105 [Candidatus Micrarchaeia archaeon]